MKENKKVSPSWGVCGRLNAATLTKFKRRFAFLSLLFCMLMLSSNAWASSAADAYKAAAPYYTILRVQTETGKGLVYAELKTSAPSKTDLSEDKYTNQKVTNQQKLGTGTVGSGSGKYTTQTYAWAMPARGYKFSTWVGVDIDGTPASGNDLETGNIKVPSGANGKADQVGSKAWSGDDGYNTVTNTAKATWSDATSYVVTYKQPEGGSYDVEYRYRTVNTSTNKFETSTETLHLTPSSGDKKPYGITDSQHENGYSYADDVVTLSSTAANFDSWLEDGVWKSNGTGANHSYVYTISKAANISAQFKNATIETPEEVSVSTYSKTEPKLGSVVFSVNATGSWTADDFTVQLQNANGPGEFVLGTKSYENGQLTVNFTYIANVFDIGSNVEMAVSPAYGTGTVASILGIATEVVDYEARVLLNDVIVTTGTLAEALEYANNLAGEEIPTLQLVQKSNNQEFITAHSTLQIKRSMILDLNSKVLKSTALDKLIFVKGNTTSDKVVLTITDNSYTAAGEIQLANNSSGAKIGVEIADANQVILGRGKLIVDNNTAAAQGFHIIDTGNLLMQGGKISVTASSDARGVYAESGFATITDGSIESSAGTNAYALYSSGTINVAEGVSMSAITTTGNEAAALYVSAGTAVMDNVGISATSAGTNAYGARVQGGKLTFNGGTIVSTAATSHAYGVYVASGASVAVQQQANITVTASTTNAYGIQNLGTLHLANSTIYATSATYPTAVNSESSAVSTTIEGGNYTANATSDHACCLHHQFGTLDVDGGIFTATSVGDNATGACATAYGILANATINAETTGTGKTAFGFTCGESGEPVINFTLTNCTIKAKSATSKAYAIYSCANVDAKDCSLEAKTLSADDVRGIYVENGANKFTNTDAVVDAYTTGAYGVKFDAGTLTIAGGSYSVTARQSTANSAADSQVYGVHVANGKTANLSNATFDVIGSRPSLSRKAYGAYTGTGTINSIGCTYTVEAATQAYGVYGAASSTLSLQNNTLSASTTSATTAYGIYSNGGFIINGDNVTSNTNESYASYAVYLESSAHGEIRDGKFKAQGTSQDASQIVNPINNKANSNNVSITGGYFYDIPNVRYYVPSSHDIYGVDISAPEYAEGYYYRVSDHLPYDNVCYIPEVSTGFPTLSEAFDYTRDHSGANYNIIMTQPYTLPAGAYMLPSNATLVVPYNGTQMSAKRGNVIKTQNAGMIAEARKLTFASGANLDVYGAIEVGGEIFIAAAGSIGYVQGPYGRIHLENGSTITLNNAATIYAWGYITGKGEIRVKSGASVYEDFQIHDMQGSSNLQGNFVASDNKNTYKVFPVNQYYIQNIEAPTKYYHGSRLYGKLGYVVRKQEIAIRDIDVIGPEGSLFQVMTDDESCWVRKSYNPTTDRILWETNSSAALGSISLSIEDIASFDSKDYTLPITHNMSIRVLSGAMTVTQSTVLLPDAKIEIDKTATVVINEKDSKNKTIKFYLYDQAQWPTASKTIKHSPSWSSSTCPRSTSVSSMKDAAIYTKGKIEVNGTIFTTAGGAAIYSHPDSAGTITFNKDAASSSYIYLSNGSGSVLHSDEMTDAYRRSVTSAQLRNGGLNGSTFTETAGIAEEGDTYAYMDLDEDGNFQWENLRTVDECVIQNKTTNTYYAKPQDYVAITSATEDANHLFYSVEGEGDWKRKFINMPTDAGCQWWEVTATLTDGVYHCATNGTYYKYNTTSESWEEYKVNVTFYLNEAKTQTKVLEVNYGAKPDASIVSNPTKGADDAATYTFSGWKSSKTGTTYAYTAELETVYEDMYYEPVFETIVKKYTITFKKAKDYTDVPVECAYGTHPSYNATRASSAQYDYEFTGWQVGSTSTIIPLGEELPIVTGAANYTAQWTSQIRSYDITWVDGDRVIEVDENLLYGTPTEYNDILPTKATDASNEYVFSGWHSSLDGQTYANGSTPTVGGETTYEAQFTATPRYLIKFVNYDGSELSSGPVTQGQIPACAVVPRRDRDATYYYVFTGWKNSNGVPYAPNALPAVTGKETYTAQYNSESRMYTITFANVDNQGASVEEIYGYDAIPSFEVSDFEDDDYKYFFAGWKDADENTYGLGDFLPAVTEDASYTALFNQIAKRMVVATEITIPENSDYEVTDLYVVSTGNLNVPASSSISATNLILESDVDGTTPSSGEIFGAEQLNITGKAYFDLKLNTASRTWHAFGVPWEVGNLDDAPLLAVDASGNATPLILGRDYDIIYYNGAKRAASGPGAQCWDYVEFLPNKNLTPGKGYMIAFTRNVYIARFTKAEGASIIYSASVRTKLYNTTIEGSNDWNAISNPALYKASMDAGITWCQIHVPDIIGSDTYTTKALADVQFVVGMSAYVQAAANRAVVISPVASILTPAPRRNQMHDVGPAEYEVTIATSGKAATDNLFVLIADDKADKYITNHDLVKAGTTTKKAQMWVDRYGLRLCVNTQSLFDGIAQYPLCIYAPQSGYYEIGTIKQRNEETQLYLTQDGQAIWNLSENGAYTLYLEKGAANGYGLRISAKVPAIATAIDEVVVDAKGETRKVLVKDKVYIIRGDNVYSIDGQLVK